MKKIKGVLLALAITVIVVTFFNGFPQAAKLTKANEFIGHVFIDGVKDAGCVKVTEAYFFPHLGEQPLGDTIQKIQSLEDMAEENKKLVRNRKKGKAKKSSGKKYRKRRDRYDGDDDDDEIIIPKEEEKSEAEQEQEKKQEEKRKQEEEKRQEEERKREEEKIKKEDWFR